MSNPTTPPIQHQLLQAVFRAPSASLSAQDKEMTDSLISDFEITAGQCAAVKRLFTAPLAKLGKVVSKARAFHRDHTFQGIGPTRIIVTGEQAKYQLGMNHHLKLIKETAEEFLAEYDTHLAAEKLLKGTAFRSEDYPPIGKMQERLRAEFLIMPMPEPGDFLKSMAGDAADQLKKDYEKALAHTSDNVRQQVLGNMLKLISETAASLAGDGPIIDSENKKGPLAKLNEYLDRVPDLNITNDPQINALMQECRKELDASTEALRESEFYRAKTAKAALTLATKFGAVGERKLAA